MLALLTLAVMHFTYGRRVGAETSTTLPISAENPSLTPVVEMRTNVPPVEPWAGFVDVERLLRKSPDMTEWARYAEEERNRLISLHGRDQGIRSFDQGTQMMRERVIRTKIRPATERAGARHKLTFVFNRDPAQKPYVNPLIYCTTVTNLLELVGSPGVLDLTLEIMPEVLASTNNP